MAKEEERKQKLEERVAKKAEQARRKEEQAKKKEEQAKKKEDQAKKKELTKQGKDPIREYCGIKRNLPGESSRKTYPKRRRIEINNVQSNQDVCSVCFGLYKDDINSGTGMVLNGCDWIQCTEEDCAAWTQQKNLI